MNPDFLSDRSETTPEAITEQIEAFCKIIDPSQEPRFVEVSPSTGAVIGECFDNVRRQVEAHGGNIQFGWIVWKLMAVMLEGEFHAVWESPDGSLVDLTPQLHKEERILFLPDSKRAYDFQSKRRTPNIRYAMVDDPLVHFYISEAGKLDERDRNMPERAFIERGFPSTLASYSLKCRYGAENEKNDAKAMLKSLIEKAPSYGMKLSLYEPCFCGSGKKFKFCCRIA